MASDSEKPVDTAHICTKPGHTSQWNHCCFKSTGVMVTISEQIANQTWLTLHQATGVIHYNAYAQASKILRATAWVRHERFQGSISCLTICRTLHPHCHTQPPTSAHSAPQHLKLQRNISRSTGKVLEVKICIEWVSQKGMPRRIWQLRSCSKHTYMSDSDHITINYTFVPVKMIGVLSQMS